MLTDAICRNTKRKPDRDVLLCDGNGLYLRIRPGGARVWLVDYLMKGKRRKSNIGEYDAGGGVGRSAEELLACGRLSLGQARFVAATWKALRRAGHDPIIERESAKAAIKTASVVEASHPTVREAADRFITQHVEGKKSARAIRYRLDRLIDLLGDVKIAQVSRQDVVAALEKIAAGRRKGLPAKQLAGEILTVAKRLWRFAESREWVAESCIEKLTRTDFDARPKRSDVALRLDELTEVWRALGDTSRCLADPITVAALRLLILTGQRENEVTAATWEEFNLEERLWRIPADRTKNGRAHLVHLAPQAVEILQALRPLTGRKRHVFASPLRDKKPIWGRSVNNALLTIFKRNKLPNVTQCHVHDLRRTLISRLPDIGVEPFIGHKIANHRLPGVLGVYNHAEYLPERKAALERWAEHIEFLAAGASVIEGSFKKAA